MPDRKAPDGMGGVSANEEDRSGPADVLAVPADTARPSIEQPQNGPGAAVDPYCFVCGKKPVQLCFNPDGPELERLLKSYFIGLKQGEGIP